MSEKPSTGQVQHAVQEHNQQLLDAALKALEEFASQLGPIGLPSTDQRDVVFLAWETARCGEEPEDFKLDVWPWAVAKIGVVAVEAAIEASAYKNGVCTGNWLASSNNKQGARPALSTWGSFSERIDLIARAFAHLGLDSQRCDKLRDLGTLLLKPTEGEATEGNSCSEDYSDGRQSGGIISVTRASADSGQSNDRKPAQMRVPSAHVQPNQSIRSALVSGHADVPHAVKAKSSTEAWGSTNSINDSTKHSICSQLRLLDPKTRNTLGTYTAGEVMELVEKKKVSQDTIVYGLAVDTANSGLNLFDNIAQVGKLQKRQAAQGACQP